MEEKPTIARRIGNVLTERIGTVVLIFAGILMVVSVLGYIFKWNWTGLPDSPKDATNTSGKTLWDWLDLLIIPTVLAAGALWFKRVDASMEAERRKAEADAARDIEEQRAQETALETYLDRMTELLLKEGLGKTEVKDEVLDVARTRTLTVLRRLNGERKGIVIRFLYEAGMIGGHTRKGGGKEHRPTNDMLKSADLSKVYLPNASFPGICLTGANLRNANLFGTNLRRAILTGANLSGANLTYTHLDGALLLNANLLFANLGIAYLKDVVLTGADLRGANLRGVKYFTCKQLWQGRDWEHTYRDEELACGVDIPPEPPKEKGML